VGPNGNAAVIDNKDAVTEQIILVAE